MSIIQDLDDHESWRPVDAFLWGFLGLIGILLLTAAICLDPLEPSEEDLAAHPVLYAASPMRLK